MTRLQPLRRALAIGLAAVLLAAVPTAPPSLPAPGEGTLSPDTRALDVVVVPKAPDAAVKIEARDDAPAGIVPVDPLPGAPAWRAASVAPILAVLRSTPFARPAPTGPPAA